MTERAVLSNINPLSKQDTNASGVSVLFAQRVYIIQRSPICSVKSGVFLLIIKHNLVTRDLSQYAKNV